jgi:membrane protein implicated in regulation of membrane protease activity
MTAFFSLLLVVGLVLNVYFVIRGTERWGRSDLAHRLDAFGRQHQLGKISVRVPVLASLCTTFGLIGYFLARTTQLHGAVVTAVGAAAAGVAVLSAVLLVRRWAVPRALRDAPDERYALQGHVAKVVEPIGPDTQGEVAYEVDGRRFSCAAQSLDGSPLPTGADVVIERVEDGVVFVEDWKRVEQRL